MTFSGSAALTFSAVIGEIALQSAYVGLAPVSSIAAATFRAWASATSGGTIDRIKPASATTFLTEPTSLRPADAASPRVDAERPSSAVITSYPLARRAFPTPCPMSPGISMPAVGHHTTSKKQHSDRRPDSPMIGAMMIILAVPCSTPATTRRSQCRIREM